MHSNNQYKWGPLVLIPVKERPAAVEELPQLGGVGQITIVN